MIFVVDIAGDAPKLVRTVAFGMNEDVDEDDYDVDDEDNVDMFQTSDSKLIRLMKSCKTVEEIDLESGDVINSVQLYE